MADISDKPKDQGQEDHFEIPAPEPPLEKSLAAAASRLEADREFQGFLTGKITRQKWDWRLAIGFKIILFIFIVGLNLWWSRSALTIVKRSATEGSKFHLDNSVLIALVSTSIANFLALVIIVAKHLFPSQDK